MQRKVAENPHFVSRLLGPLVLAVAMDGSGYVFGDIDYADERQCLLVIEHLIRPSFEQLADSTRQETKKALAYLVGSEYGSARIIEEKLLLCGVPPEASGVFLGQLWKSLFAEGAFSDIDGQHYRLVNRPLHADQFEFVRPEEMPLHERIDRLHRQLLG